MPPTGSTRPESVISPVIATSSRVGSFLIADRIAVAIVTPAGRAVLGMAPAGTWMCRSRWDMKSSGMPSAWLFARMWLSAARADSCITSPSWPVRITCWAPPSSSVASTNSTSPPASVHATPVATPGRDVRNTVSRWNRGRPRYSERCAASTRVGGAPLPASLAPCVAIRAATFVRWRRAAAPGHALRLAGVLANHGAQRLIGEIHGTGGQAVLESAAAAVHASDVALVLFGVAGQRDDLHAVEQCRVQRVQLIRRRDEQHA